jgi:hypothetical protein
MVVFLLLKEILDAVPIAAVIAVGLVAIGLEAAGIPVFAPTIEFTMGLLHAAWDWLMNLIKQEVLP